MDLCLQEGVFPKELKISKVCPIFKKGDTNEPANYRPVSIVPTLSKVFEYIVFQQLNDYFESKGYFAESQFGFRKNHSTIDAIDAMVQDILRAFESRSYAWGTFCDL
ncbi:reverse transcriptase domain-containing protein, partial [Klebsiella pneumoniae]|uniref:reverse transcriptase domain-containing protein n=1 Tax=Klebsiella pneumoniae TaxID=573 RepID=UPI00117ADBEA